MGLGSWLGRTFGDKLPNDPPGTKYFVDHGMRTDDPFVIMRILPGQTIDSPDLKRIGPKFTNDVKAGEYLAWLEGGPPFRYGPGKV